MSEPIVLAWGAMKLRVLIAILSVALGLQSLQAIRCELECAGMPPSSSSVERMVCPECTRANAQALHAMPDDCCGMTQVSMLADFRPGYTVSQTVWTALPGAPEAALSGSALPGSAVRSAFFLAALPAPGRSFIPLRV